MGKEIPSGCGPCIPDRPGVVQLQLEILAQIQTDAQSSSFQIEPLKLAGLVTNDP